MKTQIVKISSHQTSKVLALMFAAMTLPFICIGLLVLLIMPSSETNASLFSVLFFIVVPLIYGAMAYVGNRFFCFIYNVIAKNVGGIEFHSATNKQN